MAVRIRLTRTGTTNRMSYRVVAADVRFPRDGRHLESLGWYDPERKGMNFKIDCDRIEYWRARGAQISETVRSLMKRARAAGLAAAPAVGETKPPSQPTAVPADPGASASTAG